MWKIIDDNGDLYSGELKDIQLIWDLITRDIPDLSSEYRHTYIPDQLILMKKEYKDLEWSGNLHLVQIHNTIKR